jgi:hypothetical protein
MFSFERHGAAPGPLDSLGARTVTHVIRKKNNRAAHPGLTKRGMRIGSVLGLTAGWLVFVVAAPPASADPSPASQTAGFSCQPFPQTFSVPPGVTSLVYHAEGGSGADGHNYGDVQGNGPGGVGADITGTIAVTQGEVLTVTVGCNGQQETGGTVSNLQQGGGGYGWAVGGAGANATSTSNPGGGGGATGITDGSTTLVVAGGGGGGGGQGSITADNGGTGASGGAAPDGGSGGGPGAGTGGTGATVAGGTGGNGVPAHEAFTAGGGGGGGGYLGGDGGDGSSGAGGAGGGGAGSSYALAGVATMAPDYVQDAPFVLLTYTAGPVGDRSTIAACADGVVQSYTLPAGADGVSVTAIGASGGSLNSSDMGNPNQSEQDVFGVGGNGAGMTGTVAASAGTKLLYTVGCEGLAPPDSGYGATMFGDSNPGAAGGPGWTDGAAGGAGWQDPGDLALQGGSGACGGGGSTGLDINGYDTQFVIAGGGGCGGGEGFGDSGGNGGAAEGAPGTGSPGQAGSVSLLGSGPGEAGGGLADQPGDGAGGTGGDGSAATLRQNAGGGGGGAGTVSEGGGGGDAGDYSAYGAEGGGGGGGGSYTGGDALSDVDYFDTTAWRDTGSGQGSSFFGPDQNGLLIFSPLYPTSNPVPPAPVPPTISGPAAVSGIVGQGFDEGLYNVTGDPIPVVTVSSGTLPPGMYLTDNHGVYQFTGTPSSGGVYPVTLTATNGASPSASLAVTITVDGYPTVTGTPPPGQVGSAYGPFGFDLGGYPAPTVTVTSGMFPPGLSLSSSGQLTGTPTQAGDDTFTVTAHNGYVPASPSSDPEISDTVTIDIGAASTVPTAPTDVAATASYNDGEVTWVAPAQDGGSPIASYNLTVTDLSDPEASYTETSVQGTSDQVPALTVGDEYDFTVTAVNQAGTVGDPSSPSNKIIPYTQVQCPDIGPSANTPVGTAVAVDLTCSGSDITYSLDGSQPADGTVGAFDTDQVAYTPTPGFRGTDTFTVEASGPGGTANEEVSIDVGAPTVTTDPAQDVTSTGATLEGTITENGSSIDDAVFEYGTSTSYGSYSSVDRSVPTSADPVPISASVTNLTPGVTYHYQLIVDANGAQIDGGDMTFTVPTVTPPPSLGEVPFLPLLLVAGAGAGVVVLWFRRRQVA